MTPIDANSTQYESFSILNHDALFTNMRIDRNSLPDGLYAYDLRDDCDGDPCELKSTVLVNHWGTVIVKEPIENASEGIPLCEEDYDYLGHGMSLSEFMNTNPEVTQTISQ